MSRPQDRFDQELRQWGSRPPRRSAQRAAREVRERLETPRRGFTSTASWQAAAAFAAVLAVAVGLWIAHPSEDFGEATPPMPPVSSVAELAPAPLDEGVVLIWLDPETPLYLTLKAPGPGNGAETGSPEGDAS